MSLFLDKDEQFTVRKKMTAVHFSKIALDSQLKTVLYRPENWFKICRSVTMFIALVRKLFNFEIDQSY